MIAKAGRKIGLVLFLGGCAHLADPQPRAGLGAPPVASVVIFHVRF